MKSALSIAALLSICLLSGTRAQGSGVVTDCSNDSQLQTAVASGGMVTFTCSGTIPLTAGLTINANTTIDGTGQQVALDEPEFLTNTVIVNAGAALAVNNLTIQNSGYIGIINNGGILFLTNSVIAGSKDQGIFNSGTATITNSLFYGNHASAVYNIAMLTITSSTLFGNSRGLFNNGGGNATIANSIMAQNTAGNCFAAPTDGGYNLADDGSCSFTATGSQNSVSNLNLGPLAGNGGYTQTMIPGTGSPAIAAIPSGINGCAAGLSTDQIGQMRPGSLGGYCSIGAYEVQAPIAATITNCTNDSQLQSAAANGGRIIFACSGDIPLTQTLQLPQATILDGSGQSVTLDAQNQFAILVGDAGNITLNNLTFTRGLSSVDAPVFAANRLIVLNSTFASNQSSEPVDSIVSSPFLLIVNSTFTNNAAAAGVITGAGLHLITNSTFFNNTVSAQTIDFTMDPSNVSDSILNCTPNCGLASSIAYNGGSTNTLALPSGSSDIGAIPFLSGGCGTYLISDQRGVPRIQLPASGPPACDLGAYQTTQNNTALTFIAGDLGNPSYSVGTQYSLSGTNVLNLPFGTLTAISAPATQMVNGIQYTFASWSDGGAAGHTITIPPATAIYATEFTSTTPVIPSAHYNYVLDPVLAGSSSPDLLHYYINSSVASVQVLTQGIPKLDFTLLSTDCTDALVPTTCSVVVIFSPQAPGLRMGAVEFLDASNNVLGTSYISGIGFSAGLAFNSVSPVTPALNGVTAPTALAVDAAGNLYVADLLSGSLLKFAPGATTASSTIALPPGEVRAIALDGAGTLYLSNLSEQIYKFSPGSTTPVSVASGDAIAVDGEGNLYASFGDSVTEYPASGAAPVVKYSGSSNVSAIALDAAGDLFVQTQGPGDSLTKVAAGSGTQTTILTNNYTPLNSLAADAAGDVFGIMGNAAVEVPHGTNSPIKLTTGGFTFLALDSLGNLWISNGTTVQEFPRSQPPALTFGSANVSTTVGPQTISAQNIGNQPLTVTGFSSDPNFSGISACPSTAPGAFCNLSFTFAPTEAGSPLTGSLVPTDDVLGATQPVFPLSGTGLLIPQSITFDNPGPQVVGIPLALIATANSGLNVTYQSTTPAVCAVPVSTVSFLTPGTCTITASQMGSGTYAPATLVTQTFNVAATVTPSAPNNGAFFGTFTGNIAVTTVTFTFDTTETLSSTPYVVLTQGAQNLDFQAPSSAQLPTACAASQTYNAGNTCTVTIFFTPTKTYQRIGSVQLMGSSGTPIATFNLAGMGLGPQVLFPSNSAVTTLASGFVSPYGLALDGTGNVYVADTGNGIKNCHTSARCGAGTGSNTAGVYQIAAATGTLNTIGQGFGAPAGVAVDGSGNLFVADPGNGAVYEVVAVNGVVSSTSAVKTIGSVNGNFSSPTGVALDASGDVFVVDPGNSAVYEIVAVNGVVTANSVVNTLGNFTFNTPTGVALDSSGDIFVADSGNNAVYEIVAANGLVTANSLVNTIGTFTGPTGVALDGSGNLYVAAPSGTTTTLLEVLANNGNVSSSSTVVQLGSGFNGPYGVAVDARGNIFIADTGNHLAKEIDRADPPSLTFASTDVGSTSSPQSVIVQNIGDIALTGVGPGLTFGTFVQVPGSGTPADCAENFVLTYGQQCNLSISFIPTTVGPLSGTATFTDNALDASPSASQVIQLSGTGLQAGQSIVFNNPGTQVAGTPLTLNTLASSGLPVSFSATGQCTLNGSVVTFTIPGTCSITASQSGNSNYTAAAPVTQNRSMSFSAECSNRVDPCCSPCGN